jgi:hypothetical protein
MVETKSLPFLRTLLVLAGVCLAVPPAQAQYGGGTGEPNDPYLVCTPQQMNAIGANPDDWSKHFELMADIDLTTFTGNQFNIIKRFTGTFDGNHHAISHFTYSAPTGDEVAGLFGYILAPDAAVKDLGFVDPNIEAARGHAGALAGYIDSRMSIVNCYVKGGRVTGIVGVGGLVGYSADKTIRQCYATAQVTGD